MWIVFGWEKEERPIWEVATGYCYDCRRKTLWVVWNESEWVTFSAIRTLKFINKNRLHCASCTARFELSAAELGKIKRHMQAHDSIDGTPLHEHLMQRVEAAQLAGKTPLQLEFIRRSMAAEREYEQAMKERAGSEG